MCFTALESESKSLTESPLLLRTCLEKPGGCCCRCWYPYAIPYQYRHPYTYPGLRHLTPSPYCCRPIDLLVLVRPSFSVSTLGARFDPLHAPQKPGITVCPGPAVVLLSVLLPGCTKLLELGAFLCGQKNALFMIAP